MMKNSKLKQKRKNGSFKPQIKIIALVIVILAAMGLIVHRLSISETNAYFRSENESYVTLTVTDNVYDSLIDKIKSIDETDTQTSAVKSAYFNPYKLKTP